MTERFTRARTLIVGAMILNAVLALSVSLGIFLARTSWSARYEPGFPSDMLVLKNAGGDKLREVRLVLDGRFTHRVRALGPGVHGFEIQRAFEDAQENRPPSGYIPRELVILHARGVEEMKVDEREGS